MNYQSKRKLIKLNRKTNVQKGGVIASYLSDYNYESFAKIQSTDFVMAGYPKSGNTWMQNLLASVLYGIDSRYLPDSLTQEVIPDLDYKLFYKRFNNNMCFKTHDYPNLKFRNIIHLVRDPRDVMASYFAMVLGRGKNVTAEELILNEQELLFGTWWEHSLSWISNPYDANILIVKYEDLLVDTEVEMKKILEFMEIYREDEVIEKAVNGNSLSQMKKKEKNLGFDKHFIRPNNWKKGHTFVRSGKKGSGKKELSEELLSYIVEKSRDQMKYFGYSV